MPSRLVPKRSGVHRIAAIALYRALFAQCAAATQLSPAIRDGLRNIARNRFRYTRNITSIPQLRIYFEAGYEAIDHLDAAVAGDSTSVKYLEDLVTKVAPAWMKKFAGTPSQRAAPRPRPKGQSSLRPIHMDSLPLPKNGLPRLQKFRLPIDPTPTFPEAPPGSVLTRPLPLSALKGRRRVPYLVSANQIPMLRYGRRVPPALGSYINSRVIRRQDHLDRRMRLNTELNLAMAEDRWDAIVRTFTPGPGRSKSRHLKNAISADGESEVLSEMSENSSEEVEGVPPPSEELMNQPTGRETESNNADFHNDRAAAPAPTSRARVTEPRWSDSYDEALQVVEQALLKDRMKNMRVAAAMELVVAREKALLAQERAESHNVRHQAYLDRMAAAEAGSQASDEAMAADAEAKA